MRTRILEYFNFFALYGVMAERTSTAGHIITQQDVSLEWVNDFLLKVSSSKCQKYSVTTPEGTEENVQLPWNTTIVMNGNFLSLTLTKCNGMKSPPVNISLHYQELVKDLECYQTSTVDAVCSWVPNADVQALKFFYVFVNEQEIVSETTFIQLTLMVKECPLYIQTDGVGTRCNLRLSGTHIFISFREGQKGTSVNTFRIPLTSNVRPPALEWNVTKTKDKFHINWNYPEILSDWKIRIEYTECNNLKFKDVKRNINSTDLDRVSQCPYRLKIKAASTKGDTPWTEYKIFEADTHITYSYTIIVFPLMCVGLAAIFFFCFRRHKDRFFPKIPQPRDLLSSIPDSHFKPSPDNFYPNSKEELCKISLVTDLQCGQSNPLKQLLL